MLDSMKRNCDGKTSTAISKGLETCIILGVNAVYIIINFIVLV